MPEAWETSKKAYCCDKAVRAVCGDCWQLATSCVLGLWLILFTAGLTIVGLAEMLTASGVGMRAGEIPSWGSGFVTGSAYRQALQVCRCPANTHVVSSAWRVRGRLHARSWIRQSASRTGSQTMHPSFLVKMAPP